MTDQPRKIKANKKDGQLLIRINSTERDEFIQLCETMDTSAARELRKFIRSFMKKKPVSGYSYQGVTSCRSKLKS